MRIRFSQDLSILVSYRQHSLSSRDCEGGEGVHGDAIAALMTKVVFCYWWTEEVECWFEAHQHSSLGLYLAMVGQALESRR